MARFWPSSTPSVHCLLFFLTLLSGLAVTQTKKVDRPLYLFVHIPRTGGVSFGSAIEDLVGKEAVCHMRHLSSTNEPWPNILARLVNDAAMQTEFEEALSKCDVLWDHFDYGIAKMLKRITSRNVRVMTQLRPPVDRFLSSHFKQFRRAGPEIAVAELERRIGEMESGAVSPIKHMLVGYLSGCAIPFDPAMHQESCGDFDAMYAAARESVDTTPYLGLSSDPAAALRKFFRESDFAAKLPVKALTDLSEKARAQERWYTDQVTDEIRTRLSAIFELDEKLYRAAEARLSVSSSPLSAFAAGEL